MYVKLSLDKPTQNYCYRSLIAHSGKNISSFCLSLSHLWKTETYESHKKLIISALEINILSTLLIPPQDKFLVPALKAKLCDTVVNLDLSEMALNSWQQGPYL